MPEGIILLTRHRVKTLEGDKTQIYKEGINIWVSFPDENIRDIIAETCPETAISDDWDFIEDGLHEVDDFIYSLLIRDGIISEEVEP